MLFIRFFALHQPLFPKQRVMGLNGHPPAGLSQAHPSMGSSQTSGQGNLKVL